MTEVTVNNLIERLSELGRENVELIAGIEDDVNELVADLQGLKAFLKDISKIHLDDSEGMKKSAKEIRVVVYRAEDAIDKFLIEAKQHEDMHAAARWIDVRYRLAVRNVAKEIQSIRNEVNQVRAQTQTLLDANRIDSFSARTTHPREQHLSDEDDVVGFDEEANILINKLVGGSKNLESVPIVGMAGLGKSTLARKVYKDSRITFEFFNCIWVSVYQTYIIRDVLLKILANFVKRTNEHENMTIDQITDAIRTNMEKGGRCLLILDDVWNRDVIDFIKEVFPKNDKGHRIMITTRLIDVATSFSEDIHLVNFLSDANSLLLLKKKVFRKDSCPTEFEETGKSIAKKCSGLPLAIVVIAGALVGCNTQREWKLVDQNIGNLLINRDDPDCCLGFVKTSYNLLSYYQKVCFLYCATFPRGFDIPSWKLIRLWIAEGFILSDKNLTLEEQAEQCLNDLTKKNLVMVVKRTSDGNIKMCRIHDMYYEFCKKEANEEGLFQEIRLAPDQSLQMTDSRICRRLCIDSSTLIDFLSSKNFTELELVRSFLCFSSKHSQMPPSAAQIIPKAFPLIRVLDAESINLSVHSKEFFQLLHLKYVSFSGDFKVLPEPFTKFWNLETIIINSTTPQTTLEIKADIWSMLRLRHLHTNIPAKLPSPSGPSKHCCIQTLSAVAPDSCTKKVFARARFLRKLGIQGNVVALLDANAGALSNLAELEWLENLKLASDGQCSDKVIRLPKLVSIFPKNLRKLTFSGTHLDWSEMTNLGQLESLKVLKLKENAFKGEFWEIEIGGFSSLLVLWIERTDLKIWQASNHSFPSLKLLALISCENLEAVPESLADIPYLQEMKLENTNKAAVRSARKIAEKKLDRCASFGVGFKLSVFPPDTDADSESTE